MQSGQAISKRHGKQPPSRAVAILGAAVAIATALTPAQGAAATTGHRRQGGTAPGPSAQLQPGEGEAQASAPARVRVEVVSEGPLSYRVRPIVIAGARLPFAGHARGLARTETVLLEAAATPAGPWSIVARARVGANESFSSSWRAQSPGRLYLRARPERAGGVIASLPAGAAEVTVYRAAIATIYGPGFYGRPTACGQRMSRALIGVANRSLPCGTLVALTYDGRTLVAPVVDRGPYAHGASFDLTMRAAKLLGATSTVRIGALALRGARQAPSAQAPAPLAPSGGTTAP
jgi:rare lipoprotein A